MTWCRSCRDVLPWQRRSPWGRPGSPKSEGCWRKSSKEENPSSLRLWDGGCGLYHHCPADSPVRNVVQCQQSLVSSVIPEWDGNVSRLFIKSSIVLMLVGKPALYAWLLRQEIRNIQRKHWDQIFLNFRKSYHFFLDFPRENCWQRIYDKIMFSFASLRNLVYWKKI